MNTLETIECVMKIADKMYNEALQTDNDTQRMYASGMLFACGTIKDTLQ